MISRILSRERNFLEKRGVTAGLFGFEKKRENGGAQSHTLSKIETHFEALLFLFCPPFFLGTMSNEQVLKRIVKVSSLFGDIIITSKKPPPPPPVDKVPSGLLHPSSSSSILRERRSHCTSSPLLFLFCVIPPTSERARALCLLSLGPLPQPPPENTDHFVFSLFPQKRKIEEGPMDMFFCPAGFLVVVTGANLEQRFSHLLRWVECPTDLLDDPPCPPFPRVITCKHFPQQLGGQGNWVVGVGSITQDTTAREREKGENRVVAS